jgi:hypothetical protein
VKHVDLIGTCVIALVASYLVGFQHGSDQAQLALDRAVRVVEVPVANPHDSVCSQMLEAAWSIENVTPPASD